MSTIAPTVSGQVLTSTEASEALGVAYRTIHRWVETGRLKPLRNNPLLFTEADVRACAAEMALELGPLVIEAARAAS